MPTRETVDQNDDACGAIDDALRQFGGRSLVSSSEVVDCLLDLRAAIESGARLDAPSGPLEPLGDRRRLWGSH